MGVGREVMKNRNGEECHEQWVLGVVVGSGSLGGM